jgi:hypothetical protein
MDHAKSAPACKSRILIRNRWSEVRIRRSGFVPKCHGSGTLLAQKAGNEKFKHVPVSMYIPYMQNTTYYVLLIRAHLDFKKGQSRPQHASICVTRLKYCLKIPIPPPPLSGLTDDLGVNHMGIRHRALASLPRWSLYVKELNDIEYNPKYYLLMDSAAFLIMLPFHTVAKYSVFIYESDF